MRKGKLSEEQVSMLEKCFGSEHKLASERKDKLAAELGLDPRQVLSELRKQLAEEKSSSKKVHTELENHFKEKEKELKTQGFLQGLDLYKNRMFKTSPAITAELADSAKSAVSAEAYRASS
ncbi:hypothetical protein ACS0TY_035054 [Phlomoides rotata]